MVQVPSVHVVSVLIIVKIRGVKVKRLPPLPDRQVHRPASCRRCVYGLIDSNANGITYQISDLEGLPGGKYRSSNNDGLEKSRHSGEPRIMSGAGTGVQIICNRL